jgi:ketosteroid isomerase-like protein
MDTDIRATLSRWTIAERDGDTRALEALLAPEFTGIGPLGFSLSKHDWLERHAGGSLSYDAFELEDLDVREYGQAAVATALHRASGRYATHSVPPVLRMSVVLRRDAEAWQIGLAHMSFIAGTPGAPPVPGRRTEQP